MCTLIHISRLYHLCRRQKSLPVSTSQQVRRKDSPMRYGNAAAASPVKNVPSSGLLCAAIWDLTIRDCNRLNAFDMSCLRRLDNVKWFHHARNSTIRQQTIQRHVSNTFTKRRLRWFDGRLRSMPLERDLLKLHNLSPGTIDWTRPRGRPRRRWLDCVTQYLAVIDLPLAEAVHIAHHRIAWRAVLRRVTSTLDNQ